MNQKRNWPKGLLALCVWLCLLMLFGQASAAQAAESPEYQAPIWPLAVIRWDINKAYPGILYEYRLGVQGGVYPYQFSLHTAPEGMAIDPLTGTLTWVPDMEANGHEVQIDIRDQAGHHLTHRFTLDVAKDAIRFVAADGQDGNDGSGFPLPALPKAP